MAKNGPNKAAVSFRKSTVVFEESRNFQSVAETLASEKLAEFQAAEPTAKFRSSVKSYKFGPRPCARNNFKQAVAYMVRVYKVQ